MKLTYELKTWKLGGYEYTSSPTLEEGNFADVTFALMRGLIQSPLYLNKKGERRADVPDSERFPEKFDAWIRVAVEKFRSMFKEQAAFLAAEAILYPCEGSPPVSEAWFAATARERLDLGAFFLGSSILLSANVLNSAKNGTASDAEEAVPSKTTFPLSTKNTIGSRVRREQGTSKTTSKRRKKSAGSRR